MKEQENTIHIFWTGGWDSTFRLIQLLITTAKNIQPHYIVRHEDITGTEIHTMITIRRAIFDNFPEVRTRLLPTIYKNEDLITNYKDIDNEIEELRKTAQINEQYRLMSHYCKEYNIDLIDVAIDRSPGESPDLWVTQHFQNSPVFGSFSYPIKDLTKKEMHEIAKRNNWDKLLLMTSFCRRSLVKIKPCGKCGPCTDAVVSGMGFRLPLKSRLKANFIIPLRKYWRKNYVKHENNRIFKLIKKRLVSKL